MGFVLVLSGEHYVIDVAAGFTLVALTIVVWRRWGYIVAAWRYRRNVARPVDSVEPSPATDSRPPLGGRHLALLTGGAAAIAFAVRGWHLGRPGVLVFDEIFYAWQGYEIADTGVELGHSVHPPGAKWAIAVGVRVFGFNPVGWRVMALVAGAAVVALTAVIAAKVTRDRWAAAVAALVVLTDGIATVTGRLALLDGFVAVPATIGLLVLVEAVARPVDDRRWMRTCWFLGALCGLAIASKWSAGPFLAVSVAVMVLVARRAGRRWVAGAVVMVLLPVCVYVVAYIPTLINYPESAVAAKACAKHYICSTDVLSRVHAIAADQLDIASYHLNLEPQNRYATSSWHWLTQTEPTELYRDPSGPLTTRSNPAIWLFAAGCVVVLTARALRQRDRTAGVLAASALAWWLPWAIGSRPGYPFYAAPLVPVLAVAVVTVISSWNGWRRTSGLGALTGVALAGFAALAPLWFG